MVIIVNNFKYLFEVNVESFRSIPLSRITYPNNIGVRNKVKNDFFIFANTENVMRYSFLFQGHYFCNILK